METLHVEDIVLTIRKLIDGGVATHCKWKPKPTMSGAVFPKIVNTNFLVNGLQSPSDYLIDASGGQR